MGVAFFSVTAAVCRRAFLVLHAEGMLLEVVALTGIVSLEEVRLSERVLGHWECVSKVSSDTTASLVILSSRAHESERWALS